MRSADGIVRRRAIPTAVAIAFTGVLLSFLVYTQQIANELRRNAEAFSRIYFNVQLAIGSPDEANAGALFAMLGELNEIEVPVVTTDLSGTPTAVGNLPFHADLSDSVDVERVRAYVRRIDAQNPPLVNEAVNYAVHYGEPLFLRRLKWIPWLQAALLVGVVGGGAWLIRTSFRAERERIWSAMARESAHQMGTPLSSLVGWLEALESVAPQRVVSASGVDLLAEMDADVQRLQKVSRRFELIGKAPTLEPVSIGRIADQLGRYFSARLPSLGSRVRLEMDVPADLPLVSGNETLLEWAFENLIKNALDALGGKEGLIALRHVGVTDTSVVLRVVDTGPGVPHELRDRLFDIGVTSKEQGWGVGLSLTRRIIQDVHGGCISLESGDSGASFRVELPLVGERGCSA